MALKNVVFYKLAEAEYVPNRKTKMPAASPKQIVMFSKCFCFTENRCFLTNPSWMEELAGARLLLLD